MSLYAQHTAAQLADDVADRCTGLRALLRQMYDGHQGSLDPAISGLMALLEAALPLCPPDDLLTALSEATDAAVARPAVAHLEAWAEEGVSPCDPFGWEGLAGVLEDHSPAASRLVRSMLTRLAGAVGLETRLDEAISRADCPADVLRMLQALDLSPSTAAHLDRLVQREGER